MEFDGRVARRNAPSSPSEAEMDLRKGPWTVEEDLLLMNYVSMHGEGRWDSAARCAGLKRTGKSCRLRWLNYLRPDVRRGNITPQEQLLILELYSRWGNRWSKIAQHLPGRTDNEIKNYWRTRVQKHARQLRCDVNSKQFKDMLRHLWVPRLIERINAAAAAAAAPCSSVHQGATGELAPPKASSENSNTVGSSPSSPESSAEENLFSSSSAVAAAAGAADANSVREFEDMNDSHWIQETMDFGNDDWLWAAQSGGVCGDLWWWQDQEQSGWEENLLGMEDLWLQKGF